MLQDKERDRERARERERERERERVLQRKGWGCFYRELLKKMAAKKRAWKMFPFSTQPSASSPMAFARSECLCTSNPI